MDNWEELKATSVNRETMRGTIPEGKSAATPASDWRESLPNIALALLLIVGTLILYSPVRGHDFINYDDDRYVVNNSHVKAGLTWETVRWAFTSREYDNWHPITWLSHAADCQFFGLDPRLHHLTNALIHSLNALLLFALLYAATRLPAPSFVVAALFAWHPINVESVAWIAERKNLLCTFFSFLTLGAYGWYARKPEAKRFAAVAAMFFLALASKPMAVTMPFVLLLVDYWPLRRIAGWSSPSPDLSIPQQSISRLVLEKSPLLLLAVASSAVTLWAQSPEALRSEQAFPVPARIGNALFSYVVYGAKTFRPSHLGLFYPHAGSSFPLAKALMAGLILAAVSILVWMQRCARPYLIVGWLFFLGVLFPMIGIVQVGEQAMADRYAYLSTVGLFVAVVWFGFESLERLPASRFLSGGLALIALAPLWFLSSRQIAYWQNSVAIWSHTLEVTDVNLLAERKLAWALIAQGDNEGAERRFVEAVSLSPNDVVSRVNLGAYYMSHGRLEEAKENLEIAVALTNNKNLSSEDRNHRCAALLDLSFTDLRLKNYQHAIADLEAANQTDRLFLDGIEKAIGRSVTDSPSEEAYLKMSLVLRAEGRSEEAVTLLQKAVASDPEYSQAGDLLHFLTSNHP